MFGENTNPKRVKICGIGEKGVKWGIWAEMSHRMVVSLGARDQGLGISQMTNDEIRMTIEFYNDEISIFKYF